MTLRPALLPALLAAALASTSTAAAPVLDAAVRERAEALVRANEHASLVIAVIDGQDSTVTSFGAVADGKAPDADTVYEIGSATKTMTGLLLADAVVAGKARLDQPVAELLPDFRIPASGERRITLLDLATHYSGLPRLPGDLAPADPANPYADYSTDKLRSYLAGHQLTRKPGDGFEYSNLAYGLLGTALASQAGTSYESLLQQRIAQPLGMKSTSSALSPALRARLAPGHQADGKPARHWDFQAIAGAGAVLSSARDLVAYVQSYMIRPDAAHRLAVKKQAELGAGKGVALAWIVDQARGQPFIWHNGQTGGYASFIGWTVDGRKGVVVLSSTAREVDALGVASLVPGALPPLPERQKEVAMSAAELAQYEGRYALAPQFILSVRRGPDGLLVGATGQGEAPVYASGKDRFFYKVVNAQLEFKRDEQGAVSSVVLHQSGQALPGKRVQ